MVRERRLYGGRDRALRSLAERIVNYSLPDGRSPTQAAGWHVDTMRHVLAHEPPGDPVPGGAWHIARRLVRDYQFAEPGIVRALYAREDALLGRNMLLEGRFFGLRFDMGVRVTSVIDETRGAAERVWGWGYQTLQGHLEEGELTYEVIKQLRTGDVQFVITGYSRRAAISNPVVRWGFVLFGRLTQRRFYRGSVRRLDGLVRAELQGAPKLAAEVLPGGALILAPAHARPGTTLGRHRWVALPGRLRGHGVLGRKLDNES